MKAKFLIYECLFIGHHPSYLRICIEAFLDAQVTVILASPTPHLARNHLGARLSSLIEFETVADLNDKFFIENLISSANKHNPKKILILPFDEFISPILRSAFWGLYPLGSLKGLITGIYFRPRCIDPKEKGIKNWIKKVVLTNDKPNKIIERKFEYYE